MAYLLKLSVKMKPGHWQSQSVGPAVVAKTISEAQREAVEQTLVSWVHTFYALGASEDEKIHVHLTAGYGSSFSLIDEELSLKDVVSACWSSMESHAIGKGTKGYQPTHGEKDDRCRL